MSEGLQGILCFAGIALFLLGLLSGFGIPAFRSPRIGLSAHVAAIQSGLALVAVGLVGGRLTLSAGLASAIAHTLWISLYVLWIGLLVAASYGTGRTLPLAGAGLTAKPWQERLAFALIGSSSVASAAAVAALLFEWSWRAS
jgi:(hydroxyamino)benzene mutase